LKLYLVEGTRHQAVVMAKTEGEAVELAMKVDEGGESGQVLFGHVGNWEDPTAHELKLPNGWKIIQGDY